MTKPVIQGSGASLKKTGASNFWIVGSGISRGDAVKITVGGILWWEGDIKACTGEKCRASVMYVGPSKLPQDEGDLETVAVTVTNAGGEESAPHPDEAVIDGPA